MKAEELMIGDWVKVFDGFKRITQIRNVSNKKEFYSVWCDEWGMYESDLEPIPLTAEILEKNGFDKNNRHEYIYKDNYCKVCVSIGIRIQIDGIDLGEAPINVFIEGALFDININMSAIHELQHALRLCGIDKEIVL